MATRYIRVSFHQIVDHERNPFTQEVPWLAWMQHISSLADTERWQANRQSGDRTGEVAWAPPKVTGGKPTARDAIFILAKERTHRPSQTELASGQTGPAPHVHGHTYTERIMARWIDHNLLAMTKDSRESAQPDSVMNYINEKCMLQTNPHRIRGVPRPSFIDELQSRGGVVRKAGFKTSAMGLSQAMPGNTLLLGDRAGQRNLDNVWVEVKFGLDTKKRKSSTMDDEVRADGMSLLDDVRALAENNDQLDTGFIEMVDENDNQYRVSLVDEMLTAQLPVQLDSATDYVDPLVAHEKMNEAYNQYRMHVRRLLDM